MKRIHFLAIALVMMCGCEQFGSNQQDATGLQKDSVHNLSVSIVCLDTEVVDSILAAKARGEDGVKIVSAHLDAGRVMLVEDEDKVRVISANSKSARVELITGKHIGVVCYVPSKWLRTEK
jgi:hypothetical protein